MHAAATLALAFSSVALAAPKAERGPAEIRAILSIDKTTDESTVALWDSDKSKFFGKNSGSSFGGESFTDHPISFAVNENGAGNVTFGDKTYPVHSDPKHSGGSTCTRMYNQEFAEVNCLLPNIAGFSPKTVERPQPKADKRQEPCTPSKGTSKLGKGNPHQNYLHKQLSVRMQ